MMSLDGGARHKVSIVSRDLIYRHLRDGHGNRIAVICDERRLAYRELGEVISRVGHGLTCLGGVPFRPVDRHRDV
jgi:non-ribosomal peptide synthetase component E (peptide arylation enzyme)